MCFARILALHVMGDAPVTPGASSSFVSVSAPFIYWILTLLALLVILTLLALLVILMPPRGGLSIRALECQLSSMLTCSLWPP